MIFNKTHKPSAQQDLWFCSQRIYCVAPTRSLLFASYTGPTGFIAWLPQDLLLVRHGKSKKSKDLLLYLHSWCFCKIQTVPGSNFAPHRIYSPAPQDLIFAPHRIYSVLPKDLSGGRLKRYLRTPWEARCPGTGRSGSSRKVFETDRQTQTQYSIA